MTIGIERGDSARIDALPEPETHALMLGGLRILAFVARCRKA